jgi:hypothetical protein
LLLRENNIDSLPTKAFANFDAINTTSLAGNPMRNIEAEAFRDAKIKVRTGLRAILNFTPGPQG